MDKHIDALGHILVVVVFCVGFMSERVHANYERLIQHVTDLSWRMRDTVLNGGTMGPSDLAELLTAVRRVGDPVASASRLLNWVILLATAVVYGDALALVADGVSAPPHVLLVVSALFSGAVAVVVFAEYDLWRVKRDQRRMVEQTTLGRVEALDQAIKRGDVRDAGRRISELRDEFPGWGLLIELEAYLDLRGGNAERGLLRIQRHVAESDDLYLSPVVGVACALARGDVHAAFALVHDIRRRAIPVRHLDALHEALALSAAHIDPLLTRPQTSAGGTAEEPVHSTIAQKLLRDSVERGLGTARTPALELDPAEVPETADLTAALRCWHERDDIGELTRHIAGTPLAKLLPAILPDAREAAGEVAVIDWEDHANHETLGLVALAFDRPRDAVREFERAIRLMPAAARCHWGRALACHAIGWTDAARSSLQRAKTLAPDWVVVQLTEQVFDHERPVQSPARLMELYPLESSAVDCLTLALLGIDAGSRLPGHAIRDRFARALIARALQRSPRRLPAAVEVP